jgi:hypothetical protein
MRPGNKSSISHTAEQLVAWMKLGYVHTWCHDTPCKAGAFAAAVLCRQVGSGPHPQHLRALVGNGCILDLPEAVIAREQVGDVPYDMHLSRCHGQHQVSVLC